MTDEINLSEMSRDELERLAVSIHEDLHDLADRAEAYQSSVEDAFFAGHKSLENLANAIEGTLVPTVVFYKSRPWWPFRKTLVMTNAQALFVSTLLRIESARFRFGSGTRGEEEDVLARFRSELGLDKEGE